MKKHSGKGMLTAEKDNKVLRNMITKENHGRSEVKMTAPGAEGNRLRALDILVSPYISNMQNWDSEKEAI
ncbi:hypothetical protein [Paenibacillus sp. KR2-11]|uniref:hypothetical protein n=1 Tax=Paenibacillus sp. KR2-11 TaxID=3385500 RepID=UPI0038FBEF2C